MTRGMDIQSSRNIVHGLKHRRILVYKGHLYSCLQKNVIIMRTLSIKAMVINNKYCGFMSLNSLLN